MSFFGPKFGRLSRLSPQKTAPYVMNSWVSWFIELNFRSKNGGLWLRTFVLCRTFLTAAGRFLAGGCSLITSLAHPCVYSGLPRHAWKGACLPTYMVEEMRCSFSAFSRIFSRIFTRRMHAAPFSVNCPLWKRKMGKNPHAHNSRRLKNTSFSQFPLRITIVNLIPLFLEQVLLCILIRCQWWC